MNLMTIQLLPWIFLALELFLVLPAGLYLGGKIMKLQHEKFTFGSCIWINLIAGLLAGFVVEFNQYAALGVYIVLLGFMIKKQFQATYGTIAVMVIINAVIAVGYSLLKGIIIAKLLGFPLV